MLNSLYVKHLFLIFLVLPFSFTNAQVTRFIYEYKFIPDSLNQKKEIVKLMYLDVSTEKSEFFSEEKFKVDSIVYSDQLKNIYSMPPSKDYVIYRITKTNNQESTTHTALMSEKFSISVLTNFNWKIKNDFTSILDHKSQKAITT